MPHETITLDVTQGIATITLNRPEAYNALSLTLARKPSGAGLEADEESAAPLRRDHRRGKGLLRGGDVKDFTQSLPARRPPRGADDLHPRHGLAVVRTPKPVITAVNGEAAGGGLGLALAGDSRSRPSRPGSPRPTGASGPTPTVLDVLAPAPRRIRRAVELFSTNRVLTAKEAVEWGLATRAAPDAEFAAAARALAA